MSNEIILYLQRNVHFCLGLKYRISKLTLTNASYYIPADIYNFFITWQ